MKKFVFISALLFFAALALLPLIIMVGKTVFIHRVSIVTGTEGPKDEGYLTGLLLETVPDSPKESRLRIDVDDRITALFKSSDPAPFKPGDSIYFMPAVEYFEDLPGATLTLFHHEPPERDALWTRGRVDQLEGDRVTVNVRKETSLIVANEHLTSLALTPGDPVCFKTQTRFSLSNYLTLLTDKRRLGLLLNTLMVALLTVLLATTLGVIFAVVIAKLDTPGRRILSALYIIPLLIPPYITAIAWTLLFGQKGTFTEAARAAFGFGDSPLPIYGVPGSVLVLSLTYFPVVTLLTSAGLRNIPSEMEEAGILAAGRRRTLFHVSVRYVLPYIFSGAVFVFIFSLSSSGAPFLLRLQLFSSQVLVAFQTDLSGAEAMTVGIPLVLLALGAVGFQGMMENRRGAIANLRGSRRGLIIPAGRWRWVCLAFAGCVLLLAAAVPLGTLLYQARSPLNVKEALLKMSGEVKTSLWVSAATATIAVAIGAVVGYVIARMRSARGVLVDILVILPYATPAAVLGVGLIEIFNRPGFLNLIYTSSAILIWAFLIRFLPFAVKPVAAAVRSVDPALEEAARVHGVSRAKTLVHVVFRNASRGLAAAWILVFILSLGELDAALLVHPAGYQTMPIRIFNAIHFGHTELVASLCLILIFSISLPLIVYSLLTARRMDVGN